MIPSAVMQEGLIIPFIFNLLSYCVRNEWRNEWTYEWISDFLGPIHILRNIFVGLFIAHLQKFNTCTDYRHQKRAFFFKTITFGQTNWAEFFWGIWGIFGQTISTILALWVPCPWENVAGSFSYKKLWFLGLKHITPKYSQNKIWAVKNLGNNVRNSVFGATSDWPIEAINYKLKD